MLHGLEGRTLLEEPEGHLFPQFFNLLVEYIAKFSEVGYAVITTHSPILVSLLRDKLDAALYYVYRGDGGLRRLRSSTRTSWQRSWSPPLTSSS